MSTILVSRYLWSLNNSDNLERETDQLHTLIEAYAKNPELGNVDEVTGVIILFTRF